MASSSSSSFTILHSKKYEVFLSFRGQDTRNNFTSHLDAALRRKKIETFIDNELNRGDEISPSLLSKIEESKISIIVFSEGYASSRWCLEELVRILECKKEFGQIVIPIFYHIHPSNVRSQTGTFAHAFTKHEEHFKDRLDKVQSWRTALMEAANLSGSHVDASKLESLFVEEIAEDILKRLDHITPSDNNGLIGVESSIKEIKSLLCIGSTLQLGTRDVCTVGIWGIGGIGKTSMARAIFNEISSQFEGCYFTENIREESENGGLNRLRQEFLSTVLDDKNLTHNAGLTFIKKRLSRKKVLIVFDDVTDSRQMELLIGGHNWFDWFGSGSRIIVTTRDKQVLNNCRVDKIFEVKSLFHHEALQLFSRYAFEENFPKVGYMEMTDRVLKYAEGVPLALKVLGSFLFGRRKEDWESAINKLQTIPNPDIQKVLKVSYDGLDDEEKNIFLDIACFFKYEDRDIVIITLDASGFYAKIGISNLVNKSLITISNNKITMHDLLQEMGREIVRRESPDPTKRSRLWHHDEICNVLRNEKVLTKGTEAIQGISLDMSKMNNKLEVSAGAFLEMDKLRFVKFYSSWNRINESHVYMLPSELEIKFKPLCSELRYLHWHSCPGISLPQYFNMEKLVVLHMPHSDVSKIWNLRTLKHINLSHSKRLAKISDLSLYSNLESLILEGCTSLLEVASSNQCHDNLVTLNLRDCISLTSVLPNIRLKSLRKLILSGCSNLQRFPEFYASYVIEELLLDETAIEELKPSIEYLQSLVILSLSNCSRLRSLPDSICKLRFLEHLNVSGLSNLERWTGDLGNLEALKELNAERTAITVVPSAHFENLGRLRLLRDLNLADCGITHLPESLGHLYSLKSLFLSRNNFEKIPQSIIDLDKLRCLDLCYCERLQSLPRLPGDLFEIEAHGCRSLETLSDLSILFPITSENLQVVNLINCFKLDWKALGDIMEDILPKLQDMANMWWQAADKEWWVVPSSSICFPGSEIPEWFSFQGSGSSVPFELPRDWFNSEFVGFAVCAIVAFRDHHDDGKGLSVGYDIKYKGDRVGGCLVWGWDDGNSGPCYIGSDQVFLGYIFYLDLKHERLQRLVTLDSLDTHNAYMEFYLQDVNCKRIECCEVKKCGVRLLYGTYNQSQNNAAPGSSHLVYGPDCEKPMEEASTSFNSNEKEEQIKKSSRSFKGDEEEEKEEPYSNYKNKCWLQLRPPNEKEVEEFNPCTNQYSNLSSLDLNEFSRDYVGTTMDATTTKLSLAAYGGAEPSRSGCCAGQSSSFYLLDLNELAQDLVGSTMDLIATTKRSRPEPSGNICDENEPQHQRVKEYKFL